MIVARSPLRITLGGGGTDLPSYYHDHGGFLIAAAIDKYVYITAFDNFSPEIFVRYSSNERVASVDEVKHPIVREALRLTNTKSAVEIVSMADIPAGTGLGSSGSFTTALLKALHARNRHVISTQALAEQACHIELDLLKEPIGKQDQYIAAYGGITCFEFCKDGQVKTWPLAVSEEIRDNLEESLIMFFTGVTRSASAILKEQDDKTKKTDSGMIANLDYVKELGMRSKAALEAGDLEKFGRLMDEHWQHKKKRSGGMSNPHIDQWYDLAMQNGATGGKLIGAGGGGFLLFLACDKARLRHAMREAGLREVRFRFDFEGTKVIAQ